MCSGMSTKVPEAASLARSDGHPQTRATASNGVLLRAVHPRPRSIPSRGGSLFTSMASTTRTAVRSFEPPATGYFTSPPTSRRVESDERRGDRLTGLPSKEPSDATRLEGSPVGRGRPTRRHARAQAPPGGHEACLAAAAADITGTPPRPPCPRGSRFPWWLRTERMRQVLGGRGRVRRPLHISRHVV
jgi:hypothetical protein